MGCGGGSSWTHAGPGGRDGGGSTDGGPGASTATRRCVPMGRCRRRIGWHRPSTRPRPGGPGQRQARRRRRPDLRSMDASAAIDGPAGIDVPRAPDASARTDTIVIRDAAIPTDGPVVGVPALRVGPNGAMTVTFSNGTTSSGAWVGLYASSAADGAYLTYQYTGGVATGSLTFTMPETTELHLPALRRRRLHSHRHQPRLHRLVSRRPRSRFRRRRPAELRLPRGNGSVDGPCAVIPLASGKILLAGSAKTGSKNADGWEQNELAVPPRSMPTAASIPVSAPAARSTPGPRPPMPWPAAPRPRSAATARLSSRAGAGPRGWAPTTSWLASPARACSIPPSARPAS